MLVLAGRLVVFFFDQSFMLPLTENIVVPLRFLFELVYHSLISNTFRAIQLFSLLFLFFPRVFLLLSAHITIWMENLSLPTAFPTFSCQFHDSDKRWQNCTLLKLFFCHQTTATLSSNANKTLNFLKYVRNLKFVFFSKLKEVGFLGKKWFFQNGEIWSICCRICIQLNFF